MEFLRLLEGIRIPVLTEFMSAVTYLGDELCFMALAILFFWCINKRQGYYLFTVGLAGSIVNQFLKLWFRIPRPWVLDSDFTIVEAAREGASGYSFPSGHTQTAVGTFGAVAASRKERWVRALSLFFIVIVPFSRMYLGVHTPLDVGVSFGVAAVLLLILHPCFKNEERFQRTAPVLFGVLLLLAVAYMIFVTVYPFPADVDAHNLTSGTKNAFTLCGTVLGIIVVYFADRKWLHFKTEAPVPGQILKYVIGLVLVVAVKSGLKAPLNALFGGGQIANLVRYFLMVIVAGCIWPMTFPFWAKVGRKR